MPGADPVTEPRAGRGDDLAAGTIHDVAPLVRARNVSATEVIEATLRRIEERGPSLACFTTTLADQALDDARALDRDRRRRLGVLAGVAISVKDNIDVAGVPTSLGSGSRMGAIAGADARCIQRLRQAGAVIIAKANMWELACAGHDSRTGYGEPSNPWAPERETGGSSSGSGVAVAAGLGHASIATDGGGSIRVPAAMVGVTGLKPTFGLVDTMGVVSHLDSLDHLGPLTRSAMDAAIVLQALTLRRRSAVDELEQGARGLRAAFIELPTREPVDGMVRRALDEAFTIMTGEGVRTDRIRPPWPFHDPAVMIQTIASAEGAEYYRADLEAGPSYLGGAARRFLRSGQRVKAEAYVHGQRRRVLLRHAIDEALADRDVLVLPTTPRAARPRDARDRHGRDAIRYTAAFNLTGHPVIAIPCGIDDAGMPISLQIVGRHGAEPVLLRVAHAFQGATSWHLRRPTHPPGSERTSDERRAETK